MRVFKDHPDAWLPSGDGVRRKVICASKELMMVEFAFEKGGVGAPHSHPHIQSTCVASGTYEFTIDGETQTIQAGDGVVIASNAVHSCVCIEAGSLIDTFTPVREDFLEAHGISLD